MKKIIKKIKRGHRKNNMHKINMRSNIIYAGVFISMAIISFLAISSSKLQNKYEEHDLTRQGKEFSIGDYRVSIVSNYRVKGEDFPRPLPGYISDWFQMYVYDKEGNAVDLYPNQESHPHPDSPNKLTIGWVGKEEIHLYDDEGNIKDTIRGADFRNRFWSSVARRISKAAVGKSLGLSINQVKDSDIPEIPMLVPLDMSEMAIDEAIEALTGRLAYVDTQIPFGTVVNIDANFDSWVNSTGSVTENETGTTLTVGYQSGNTQRAQIRFPLSSIPAGASVNDVDAQFNQTANSSVESGDTLNWTRYGTSNPDTDSATNKFNNSAIEAYAFSTGHNTNGSKTNDLGSTADSDVQNQIDNPDWFTYALLGGTGFQSGETITIEAIENAGNDPSTLTVDYTSLEVDLTENGTAFDDGVSNPGGEDESKAFDNMAHTKWLVFQNTGNIGYDFNGSTAYIVTSYALTSANDADDRDPKNWTFQGSNNGSSWTTLNTQSNQDFTSRYQTKTYNIGNSTPYQMYRLNITANNGSSDMQLGELQMFGTLAPTNTPTPTPTNTPTPTPTPSGNFTIVKACSGDADGFEFDVYPFAPPGSSIATPTLNCGQSSSLITLELAKIYDVLEESAPSGSTLEDVECTGGTPGVVFNYSAHSNGVRITTPGGAFSAITCTFTSSQSSGPTITGSPTASYGSLTRTGPSNTPFTVSFTATDTQQTGANQLNYQIRTAAGTGGTLVASGTFTSGVQRQVSVAYDASGLSSGSNTLYLRVTDGTNDASTNPSFTVLRDDANPTAATSISHNPNPVNTSSKQYTVTFTPHDVLSTASNEIRYQIRTSTGGGGTLLYPGSNFDTSTNNSAKTTGTITDSTLTSGSNTRYVRQCDGANNCVDTSFTVTGVTGPTTSTLAETNLRPNDVTLNGQANPNGTVTTGYFRYWTSNPGSCTDSGGTRAPSSSGSSLGSGSTNVAFSQGIEGLTPGTTIYYCAIADNGIKGFGSIVSFTVPGHGTCASVPMSGNYTISTSCIFGGGTTTYDGVDGGAGNNNTAAINIQSGRTLTVGPSQTVAWGTINKVGASMILFKGGTLVKAPLWVPDSDTDTYPNTVGTQGQVLSKTQPEGYMRRTVAANKAEDCEPENGYIFQEVSVGTDSDGDGVTGSSSVECVGAEQGGLYMDSDGDYTLSAGAGSDCNDANQYIWQNVTSLATDGDQDGYYTGSGSTTCVGGTTTASGRTYYRTAVSTYNKIKTSGGGGAIGSSDCSDSNAFIYQTVANLAADTNQNGYYTGSPASQCVGGTQNVNVPYSYDDDAIYNSTSTWQAPVGTTQVSVVCWGGGGGGRGGSDGSGGGGGGGGAYSAGTANVTAGNTYNVVVGTGGSGGTGNRFSCSTSCFGGTGGDSYFNNTSTIMAKGGVGSNSTSGASGGSSTSSVGTTKRQGGNGGNRQGFIGGGGGGSAGASANGGNGGAGTAGSAGSGGGAQGGAGSLSNGGSGNTPGAGGGGAGGYDGQNFNGGSGANGRCTLAWSASGTLNATYYRNSSGNYTWISSSQALGSE